MYNETLILIGAEKYSKDKNGNLVPNETSRKEVYCNKTSITRGEFYLSGQLGLNPEIAFKINSFEYSGEQTVLYGGKKYAVLRSYQSNDGLGETIELVCTQSTKNGENRNR